MAEHIASFEISPTERIYKLRGQINDLKRFDLFDEIVSFDKKLKQQMVEAFGSTKLLQQVDVWQALIGGTIEPRTSITEEQYRDISTKILAFVKKLEEKLRE